MNEACIFCRIASGEAECRRVYETAKSVAFLDLCPVRPGHTLVVPKAHFAVFHAMEDEHFLDAMACARRLGAVLDQAFRPRRVGMLVAGFDIPHVHIHLVPMHDYHDLTSKVLLEGKVSPASSEELEDRAAAIRELVEKLPLPGNTREGCQ